MLRDLLSIIYPEKCSGCQKALLRGEAYICLNCRSDLPRSFDYQKKSPEIMDKLRGASQMAFVYSYLKFRKGGTVQSILHELKYENKQKMGVLLGNWFGEELIDEGVELPEDGILVPVPLHKKKISERGYNQSECIAIGLAESLKLKVQSDVIIRQKYTKTQTHKNREERWENVKDSFIIKDSASLKGQHVILVDDVLTTGATIDACSEKLLKQGINSIGVLVLAEAI